MATTVAKSNNASVAAPVEPDFGLTGLVGVNARITLPRNLDKLSVDPSLVQHLAALWQKADEKSQADTAASHDKTRIKVGQLISDGELANNRDNRRRAGRYAPKVDAIKPRQRGGRTTD